MKSTKLLIALSLAFGALTLNSCSKTTITTTTKISMTADIDGTTTSFNTNATAVTGSVSGQTYTNITGQAKDGTVLSIVLEVAPTAGKTYSDAATSDSGKPLIAITPPGNDADSFLNDDDDSNNLPTLTIGTVSSGTITGTFKGLVQGSIPLTNSVTPPTKLITNGTFTLKYITQ